jgi:hypothetical protein
MHMQHIESTTGYTRHICGAPLPQTIERHLKPYSGPEVQDPTQTLRLVNETPLYVPFYMFHIIYVIPLLG